MNKLTILDAYFLIIITILTIFAIFSLKSLHNLEMAIENNEISRVTEVIHQYDIKSYGTVNLPGDYHGTTTEVRSTPINRRK